MRAKLGYVYAAAIVALLLLGGCGARPDGHAGAPAPSASGTQQPGFVGYVVKIEGGRILVVAPEARDFSATGGISHYYEAIWFSKVPSDIGIGMKVEVWADAIAESYPAQAAATRLAVIAELKPEGARLTPAEAIARAIESLPEQDTAFPVVAGAEYASSTASWTVDLVNESRDAIVPVQVEDK